MLAALKSFLLGEDGGAIEWILVAIVGAIIIAVAFIKLRSSPGDIGTSIQQAGQNAAQGLDQIRVY